VLAYIEWSETDFKEKSLRHPAESPDRPKSLYTLNHVGEFLKKIKDFPVRSSANG